MRTLTQTQLAAQLLPAREPYIRVVFTSGATTYDASVVNDGSGRTLQIEHEEWPYLGTSGASYILLNNYDRTVPDLRGYWIEIGYGDYGTNGAEYASTPRMWVVDQRLTSAPGVLSTVVKLKDSWGVLSEFETTLKGVAPYFNGAYEGDTTSYAIILAIFAEAGFTLNALAQSDGIIDVFTPYFDINSSGDYENAAALAYRLSYLSKEYLRPLPSMQFEFVFPQSGDAVDETYYTVSTDGYLPCFSFTSIDTEVIPNHIITYCNKGTDWSGIITGEASDATSIARYHDVTKHYRLETVTTQPLATSMAEAILIHSITESASAMLETPHDARVQLYDRESIIETRGV